MDDRDSTDHQNLIAHTKQVREVSRELIADARATVARSWDIIRRIRQETLPAPTSSE